MPTPERVKKLAQGLVDAADAARAAQSRAVTDPLIAETETVLRRMWEQQAAHIAAQLAPEQRPTMPELTEAQAAMLEVFWRDEDGYFRLVEFNPYHDARGRFATAQGAGAPLAAVEAKAKELLALDPDHEIGVLFGKDGKVLAQVEGTVRTPITAKMLELRAQGIETASTLHIHPTHIRAEEDPELAKLPGQNPKQRVNIDLKGPSGGDIYLSDFSSTDYVVSHGYLFAWSRGTKYEYGKNDNMTVKNAMDTTRPDSAINRAFARVQSSAGKPDFWLKVYGETYRIMEDEIPGFTMKISKLGESLREFNPYHDERGRFTSPGGGSGSFHDPNALGSDVLRKINARMGGELGPTAGAIVGNSGYDAMNKYDALQSGYTTVGAFKERRFVSSQDYEVTTDPSLRYAVRRWIDPTDSFQQQVNGGLRHDKTFSGDAITANAIKDMDRWCTGTRLEVPTTLYRGSVMAEVPKVGTILRDKGFQSTSTNEVVASVFGQGRNDGLCLGVNVPNMAGTTCVFRIRCPKGQKLGLGEEQIGEVILPRNTAYKVTGQHHVGSVYYLDAKVVSTL